MKQLNLKATLVCTAIAMTFLTLNRFISWLPQFECWSDIYYGMIGIYHLITGTYSAICMVLLGFALYQNRMELNSLSSVMKIQAQIIFWMVIINLLWHVVFYSLGAENIAEIYTKIGYWWLTVEYIMLTVWLWQLAIVPHRKIHSEEIGKIGRICSWLFIVTLILWIVVIVGLLLLSKMKEDSMTDFHKVINIIDILRVEFTRVLFSVLLGSYYWFSHRWIETNSEEL